MALTTRRLQGRIISANGGQPIVAGKVVADAVDGDGNVLQHIADTVTGDMAAPHAVDTFGPTSSVDRDADGNVDTNELGGWKIDLPVTDSADTDPTGFGWRVTVINNSSGKTLAGPVTIEVPAGATPLELGKIAPHTPVPAFVSLVTLADFTDLEDRVTTLEEAPGGGGVTDLGFARDASTVTVQSSTGTDATLPAADNDNAGVMTAAQQQKLADIESSADVTDAGNVGSAVHGSTAKATPVDADTVPLIDSEASNGLKKLTFGNLKSGLSATFAQRPQGIASLTDAFFVVAHRGGANSGPENTLEAFRVAASGGAECLETDLQPLADGSLVLMHDATVDRTTNGTGNVNTYTLPRMLALDARDDAFAAGWPPGAVKVPTFEQFLAEFSYYRVLIVQPKDSSNLTQLLDLGDDWGLVGQMMIETTADGLSTTAANRGYKVYRVFTGAEPSVATVQAAIAAGAWVIRIDESTATDTRVAELLALGRPLVLGGAHRRYQRDRAIALGAHGAAGDYPVYLKRTTAITTTDPWRYGSLGIGTLTSKPDLPVLVSGGIQDDSGGPLMIHCGDMCPLANATGTYTLSSDFSFPTTVATQRFQFDFAMPDDKDYTMSGSSYFTGYNVEVNPATGAISLRKLDAAAPANLQTGNIGALTANTVYTCVLTVTPTTVTAAIKNGGTTMATLTATDSSYRGGYFRLRRFNGGNIRFANLSVV